MPSKGESHGADDGVTFLAMTPRLDNLSDSGTRIASDGLASGSASGFAAAFASSNVGTDDVEKSMARRCFMV